MEKLDFGAMPIHRRIGQNLNWRAMLGKKETAMYQSPRRPAKHPPWVSMLTNEQKKMNQECWWYHDDEQKVIGPVPMLDVRKMIDAWQIRPDTRVMLCTDDQWRPYWQLESSMYPSKLVRMRDLENLAAYGISVLYKSRGFEWGPILLSKLFAMLLTKEIPADTPVCIDGAERWVAAGEYSITEMLGELGLHGDLSVELNEWMIELKACHQEEKEH